MKLVYDYSKLRGRIVEKFGTQRAFAEAVGRTDTFVSGVLNGRSDLSQTEVEKWAIALEIELDLYGLYFFAH